MRRVVYLTLRRDLYAQRGVPHPKEGYLYAQKVYLSLGRQGGMYTTVNTPVKQGGMYTTVNPP